MTLFAYPTHAESGAYRIDVLLFSALLLATLAEHHELYTLH